MIQFEKVSYDTFRAACRKLNPRMQDPDIQKAYDAITIPKRGTKGSAGYDFVTPFPFKIGFWKRLLRKQTVIPLGIKAMMPPDVVLLLMPRSGTGFKTGTALSNTIGVIDSSYYNNPSNEGHMMVSFDPGFANWKAKRGDRIIQGIFVDYWTADDEDGLGERTGGFGSTGR